MVGEVGFGLPRPPTSLGDDLDLSQMRTEFREQSSDLESALDNAEIDRYLNRAYQFTVPEEVGGEWSETIWGLQLTGEGVSWPYPEQILGPNKGTAYIESYFNGSGQDFINGTGQEPIGPYSVRILTEPSIFEHHYEKDSGTGRPTTILFYGRKAILDIAPDLPYLVKIPSRGGPTVALTDSGLDHETHAKAVVHSGAADFLARVEDADGSTRNMALAEMYFTRLRRISQVRPNQRRWARSF